MRLRCEGIYHIQASLRIAKGIKQHHAIYKGMFPEAKMDFLTSQKKLFNLKRSTSTTPHPGQRDTETFPQHRPYGDVAELGPRFSPD